MRADTEKWLSWAANNNIHAAILEYIKVRPDHLWSKPPKHEEPFSTPRSWHMLSDIMQAWSKGSLDESTVKTLASGLLTPNHAQQFGAFFKQQASAYTLNAILKGEARWPDKPEERDVLYFMVQSFRAQLIKELPIENHKMGNEAQKLNLRAKDLIIQLARISLEMAQLVVTDDENGKALPNWFLMEISRDLPRLISR